MKTSEMLCSSLINFLFEALVLKHLVIIRKKFSRKAQFNFLLMRILWSMTQTEGHQRVIKGTSNRKMFLSSLRQLFEKDKSH